MRQPGQPPFDVDDQPRLAIEQMGATRDVEDQPVGRVERDERGVARASLRQPVEPVLVEHRIVGDDGKLRHPCPRVGERHADAKPDRVRAGVDAGDA